MSKRERNPKMPENAPESKKAKLENESRGSSSDDKKRGKQGGDKRESRRLRSNSPVPGPSSASSDPNIRIPTGLIPIYRYFDHKNLEEFSSQDSTSGTDAGTDAGTTTTTTSTGDTASSTNVEVGDSRTGSIEDMDVDSEVTTSESSASNENRRRGHRYRKHKSRRDQN